MGWFRGLLPTLRAGRHPSCCKADPTRALKRFLVDDGIGKEARFWKLAQSLSALYPPGTDEKRSVDGVLARKKGLGL